MLRIAHDIAHVCVAHEHTPRVKHAARTTHKWHDNSLFCYCTNKRIKLLKESLGVEMCRHILFAHAITGCDTTSRIHRIGKPTVMKLLSTDLIFRRVSEEFLNSENRFNKNTIATAGETAVKMLYGESGDCNIDKLRSKKFKIKASSKSRITQIEPSSLPPTKAACVQHSFRVFHQVQTWISFETQLPPTEWGWELKENGIL